METTAKNGNRRSRAVIQRRGSRRCLWGFARSFMGFTIFHSAIFKTGVFGCCVVFDAIAMGDVHFLVILSIPPIYGCRTGGISTEPSGC